MKKCYQYDNQGYFQFVDLDYGQGLPHNATYIKPPLEKDGYFLKFDGLSWIYEEMPKELEPPKLTLEELKQNAILTLKAVRDQKEAGGFSYLGKIFDSDEKACLKISISAQNAGFAITTNQEFTPIQWTCKDNTSIELSGQQLMGLSAALATHSGKMHGIYNYLKSLVEQASTEEELKEIQWPDPEEK